MKIVDRKTFLEMPPGIVFAKFEPYSFQDLEIKCESVGPDDYVSQPLIAWPEQVTNTETWIAELDAAMSGIETSPLDYECTERDALYDQKQLFAVWSSEDLTRLIVRLQQALADGYEK